MLNQTAWWTANADGTNPVITSTATNTPLATVNSSDAWITNGNGEVVIGNIIFDHAFGALNGPLGYGNGRMSNVGINSLTTKIGDLTFQNLNQNVRIYPQRHNGTKDNTGYENIVNASTGSGGRTVDASVYYTSTVRTKDYSLRTFEMENLLYKGQTSSTTNYSVAFISQTDEDLYRQAVKINGSVTIGDADNFGYGGINFGLNNAGTTNPQYATLHSLTVNGNFNMYGEVYSNWNVSKNRITRFIEDIEDNKAAYYKGDAADIIIKGVVNMNGGGSLWPNLQLNNTVNATYNNVYRIGGLSGNGNVEPGVNSVGTVHLVLNNTSNLTYAGVITDNNRGNMKLKVVMAGSDDSRQVLTQTYQPNNMGWKMGTEIVSGTLAMHTANEEVFMQGDLTISGGRLEITQNLLATFPYARFVGKDFHWSGGKVKTEFLNSSIHGSDAGMISLMEFAGGVYLDGAGDFIFEFSGVEDAGTYIIMEWATASLTKADESKFSAIANGWDVIFEIDETAMTLSATFVVPEPSTVAAVMGMCVLAFALIRRRK